MIKKEKKKKKRRDDGFLSLDKTISSRGRNNRCEPFIPVHHLLFVSANVPNGILGSSVQAAREKVL